MLGHRQTEGLCSDILQALPTPARQVLLLPDTRNYTSSLLKPHKKASSSSKAVEKDKVFAPKFGVLDLEKRNVVSVSHLQFLFGGGESLMSTGGGRIGQGLLSQRCLQEGSAKW